MSDGYLEWCERTGETHAHCPFGCEHPQPFVLDGELVCGRCWHVDGLVTKMVLCTDDIC